MGKLLLAVHAREKFFQWRVLFRLNEFPQGFVTLTIIFVVSHLVQFQSLLGKIFVADLALVRPLLNNRNALRFDQDFLLFLRSDLLITRHLSRVVGVVTVLRGAGEGNFVLGVADVLFARPLDVRLHREDLMEPLGVEEEPLLCEVLVTDVAPDQLGPRVDPLMLNQLPGLDEHQPTRVALVLVAMQLHVRLHDVLRNT